MVPLPVSDCLILFPENTGMLIHRKNKITTHLVKVPTGSVVLIESGTKTIIYGINND
jgi:hypothetical protein